MTDTQTDNAWEDTHSKVASESIYPPAFQRPPANEGTGVNRK